MAYLSALAWPTVSIGWMLSIYQRAKASMKRLEAIFLAVPTVTIGEGEGRLETSGAIEWDHVSFSYFANGAANGNGSHAWALRDISVKVPPGGKLAIVGRTGSGKSTMLKLLARLIEPTSGRVLLDGRDVRQLPLAGLAAQNRRTGAAGAGRSFPTRSRAISRSAGSTRRRRRSHRRRMSPDSTAT